MAWIERARVPGQVSPRLGEALVATGALSAQAVHELLAGLGLQVLACPSCRSAFNAPQGSEQRCPRDGTPLQPAPGALRVLGDLGHGSGRLSASSGRVPAPASDPSGLQARTLIAAPPPSTGPGLSSSSSSSSSSSGERLPAAAPGGYELGDELARGGFGAIYVARDRGLEREVALKVLHDGGEETDQLRFLEEARVTGQLEHPNIVPVHDCGQRADGSHFFTMKLVRGQSLRELIDAHASGEEEVSLRRYLEVFAKILDAVAFAHARGVIHRDLKPANVMLGEFGEVLVMDWGLAKVRGQGTSLRDSVRSLREVEQAEAGWTVDGAIAGTPAYMSPEQANGETEAIDERSDVYALGAILYELLTLKRAFSGPLTALLARKLDGTYVDPAEAAGERDVPPELAAVVRKAMALQIDERYESAAALREDVDNFLEGRAVSARRDPLLTRLRKWAWRNRTPVAAASVALVFSAVLMVRAFLLPASVRVDLAGAPAGAEVFLGERQLGRTPELGAEVVARVWPPGAREVSVRHEGQTWSTLLALASGAEEQVSVPAAGRLRVDLSKLRQAPEGTRLRFAGEVVATLAERSARRDEVQLEVWPPRAAELAVLLPESEQPVDTQAPPVQPGETTLVLPRLELPRARLELIQPPGIRRELWVAGGVDPYGNELTRPRRVQGELSLRPGQQRLRLLSPGCFPEELTLELAVSREDEAPQRAEVRFEPNVHERGERVLPDLRTGRLADVDEDGTPELILSNAAYLSVLRLELPPVELWRRAWTADLGSRGDFELVDLEGDGQLELSVPAGERIDLLDALSGRTRRNFPFKGCKLRAVDLDQDGRHELAIGTGYRGTKLFDEQGMRWATHTGRYPFWGYLLEVPFPDGPPGLLTRSNTEPLQLELLDAQGGVRWRRPWHADRPEALLVRPPAAPLLISHSGHLRAHDLRQGRLVWERPELGGVGRLEAGLLGPRARPVVIAHRSGRALCLDGASGESLWSVEGIAGPGGFGDADGDGSFEWLQWCKSEVEGTRWLRAYGPGGEVEQELLVESNPGATILPPRALDLFGDGEPAILHLERNRLALLRVRRQGVPEPSRLELGVSCFDLDGDGTLERFSVGVSGGDPPRRLLSGSVWAEPLDLATTRIGNDFAFALDAGDFDGDGVRDLGLTGSAGVIVRSGRPGGELLLDAPLTGIRASSDGLFEPPGRGKQRIVVVANQVHRFAHGEEPQTWGIHPIEPQWGAAEVEGERRFYFGGKSQRGFCVWAVSDGGQLRGEQPLPHAVVRAPVLLAEGRLHFGLADGRVASVAPDFGDAPRYYPLVTVNVFDQVVRRGPEGPEVVATSGLAELGRASLRSGRVLAPWVVPPAFAHMARVNLFAHDFDGDALDELVLANEEGAIVVLDGEELRPVFATLALAVPKGALFDARPRLLSTGELVVYTTRGARILSDFPQRVVAQRRPRPDPQVALLEVARALARGLPERARAAARQLRPGFAARRAKVLLEGRGQGPSQHVAKLALRPAAELDSAALLAETRRQVGSDLRRALEALPSGPARALVLRHLRAALGPEAREELLADAEQARRGGLFEEARALLRAGVILYGDPELRRRFEHATAERAMHLQRGFDRIRPPVVVLDALKVCPRSARLHTLAALLLAVRQRGEEALTQAQLALRHASEAERPWVAAHLLDFYQGQPQQAELWAALQGSNDPCAQIRRATREGDPARALALLDVALARELDDPLFQLHELGHKQRAKALFALGRALEGAQALVRSVAWQMPRAPALQLEQLKQAVGLFQGGHFAAAALLAERWLAGPDSNLARQAQQLVVAARLRQAQQILPQDRAAALKLVETALIQGAKPEQVRQAGLEALLADPQLAPYLQEGE